MRSGSIQGASPYRSVLACGVTSGGGTAGMLYFTFFIERRLRAQETADVIL